MAGVSVVVGVAPVVTCDCTNICVLASHGSSGSSAGHGLAGIQTSLRTAHRHALVIRDCNIGQSLVADVLDFVGPLHRFTYRDVGAGRVIGVLTVRELLDADVMLSAGEMNLVSSYYDYLISTYEIKKMINK